MFELYNDLLFVVDEVIDDISACLFIMNKLNISNKFIKRFKVNQNVSICVFRLNTYNYHDMERLKDILQAVLKDKDTKIAKLIFPLYIFFNKYLSNSSTMFVEGAMCFNTFFTKRLYITDYINGNYSMAQKSLNKFKIKNFLYKQYKTKDKNLLLSLFLINKNVNREDLMNAIIDLKDTFLILNQKETWEESNLYLQKMFLKENDDGKEKTI